MAAKKGNKTAVGNKGGRPAKLDESNMNEVAEQMVKFFKKKYQTFVTELKTYHKNKNRGVKPLVDVPFYSDFAEEVDISYRTLRECDSELNDVFSQAWRKCKEIQGRYIALATMNGFSHSSFSIFFASNLTDWRSKQQVAGVNDGPIEFKEIEELDDESLRKLANIGSAG